MPGWTTMERLIAAEGTQLVQEGLAPNGVDAAMREALARMGGGATEAEVWAAFDDLPRNPQFPFEEPSDFEGIRARRTAAPSPPKADFSRDVLADKMLGAWLGRCAGCALGKPVEAFLRSHNGMVSWRRQKAYLTGVSPSEWPLRDFIPRHSPAENATGEIIFPQSTREHIAFMESDDDIRYTVLGQIVLDRFGRQFRSSHVANAWLDRLGYCLVCTGETQAYRNMVISADGLRSIPSMEAARKLDDTIDWRWVTHHLNPYREWIGAQIRVDSYGYAAPGDPELAAEFAWRDARISHAKNGIYGAMFCAAMISTAFVTDDVHEIVEAGLAQIPFTSRLYAEIRQVIQLCARHGNRFDAFETVIEEIYRLLGHYDAVHTNNNAALCVMALLLGGGDFHKGITLAVMGGWDSDCNGATVGSIVGAICGGRRVPVQWSAPLHDSLCSQIVDYHPIDISECARRSIQIARRIGAEK